MKTRYKIVILILLVIAIVFVFSNPFSSGYFPFPWNNMNDTYCWSYFQAFHDEPIDAFALNLHIRNEIAKYGWEINVPWRGIEIDSGANSTGIMVTGSWHGVTQFIDGKETQIGVNLIDDIAKFEGIKEVKSSSQVCA